MPGVPRTQPALSLSQICAASAENRGGAAAPWRSKNPQSAPSEANVRLRRKQSELRAPKIAAEPLRRGDPKIRRAHRAKRMRDCGERITLQPPLTSFAHRVFRCAHNSRSCCRPRNPQRESRSVATDRVCGAISSICERRESRRSRSALAYRVLGAGLEPARP